MAYQQYQSPRSLNIQTAPSPGGANMQSNSYVQGLQRMKDIQAQMQQRYADQRAAAGTAAGRGAYAASTQDFGRGPQTGQPGTTSPADPRYRQWNPPAASTWGTGAPQAQAQPAGASPPTDLKAYMENQRGTAQFNRDFARAVPQPAPSQPMAMGSTVGGYGMTPELQQQRRAAFGGGMGASYGLGAAGRGFGR